MSLKGSDFSDSFGGYAPPDPVVRVISNYKIRKADHGVPYLKLCYENQSVALRGNFLLDSSDADLIERIREETGKLKVKEQEYQKTLISDVALLREVCKSVGVEVDEYIEGNFKYFLNQYLKSKGLDWDFYVVKLNGNSYAIEWNGSHSLSAFLQLVDKELNKPTFEQLIVEFKALLKKPQTSGNRKKIDEIRDLLYKQGTRDQLRLI